MKNFFSNLLSLESIKHYFVASLPLLIIIGILYVFIGSETDIYHFFQIHAREHPFQKKMLTWITDWGNAVFYLIYGVLFIQAIKNENRSQLTFVIYYIFFQILISFFVVRVIKIGMGRPRPGVEGLFGVLSLESRHNSFPSGHTTEITGAVIPLALWRSKYAVTLVLGIFGALVAFSRVYLGKHHPSDLLAGWVLGSLSGLLIYICWKNHIRKDKIAPEGKKNGRIVFSKTPSFIALGILALTVLLMAASFFGLRQNVNNIHSRIQRLDVQEMQQLDYRIAALEKQVRDLEQIPETARAMQLIHLVEQTEQLANRLRSSPHHDVEAALSELENRLRQIRDHLKMQKN